MFANEFVFSKGLLSLLDIMLKWDKKEDFFVNNNTVFSYYHKHRLKISLKLLIINGCVTIVSFLKEDMMIKILFYTILCNLLHG